MRLLKNSTNNMIIDNGILQNNNVIVLNNLYQENLIQQLSTLEILQNQEIHNLNIDELNIQGTTDANSIDLLTTSQINQTTTFLNINSISNNGVLMISNYVQLNNSNISLQGCSLSFNYMQDEYLQKSIINWSQDADQIELKDELGDLLYLHYDTTYTDDKFVNKSGDTMSDMLEVMNISDGQNVKSQQNLNYFIDTMQDYINHEHTQYVSQLGEDDGQGKGTVNGYVTLTGNPIHNTHQATKQYVDEIQTGVSGIQHTQYISRTQDDSMQTSQYLKLNSSINPTIPSHQQPLRYLNVTLDGIKTTHTHDSDYIGLDTPFDQLIWRIPKLTIGKYLKPSDIEKHETHIQSKSYQDFNIGKSRNGYIYLSHQHYLLGNMFKIDGDYLSGNSVNNIYTLTFDFSTWYNDYNQNYKLYMNTEDNFPEEDFIVIPIITLNSIEHCSSTILNDVQKLENYRKSWFGISELDMQEYFDQVVENIIYDQSKKFIFSVDVGVKPQNINGNRIPSMGVLLSGRNTKPIQTFSMVFLGGPSNYVFNKSQIPDQVKNQVTSYGTIEFHDII